MKLINYDRVTFLVLGMVFKPSFKRIKNEKMNFILATTKILLYQNISFYHILYLFRLKQIQKVF